ncbi:MAG TPA: EAL domain-containing protein [Actinomycetes bacterium]|nr:EAL domain-containing protein [Actinomycetes bacterium]
MSLIEAPPVKSLTGAAWVGNPPPALTILALAAAVVIGELRPVPIPRGGDAHDSITISTTFTVALVILGPVSIAMLAQGLAVLIDDIRGRKSIDKIVFNLAQYMVAIASARVVFCAISGTGLDGVFSGSAPFVPDAQNFLAALAAGLTFLIANHLLVSAVLALASNQPIVPVFFEDLRFQAMTAGVLAALGPVAAVTVEAQPLMLPLLVAPVVAVYNSATLAVAKEQQAYHDSLTGLANRELFRDRSVRALEESKRTQTPLAIMMIDLDHFKEINDTLGHQVGDELICEVSRRLHEARPVGSTVARLGGDEFAVLLPDVPDLSVAEDVATYLLSVLSKSFSAGGVRLVVQASLGISLAPDHGDDVHTLMKRADIALYEAKRERARFCAYRAEEDVHTPQRLAILADLRSAVDEDELFLEYQPKINLETGHVSGVEALVRWNHPTRGVIRPDDFIPLAENTGLITPITWFVVERALQQVRVWQDSGLDLDIAVNLSVRHLTDMSLPDRIAVALERWGVAPSKLIIEVTESSIMTDPKRAAGVLQQLRRIGVAVAIDDYGTGHASLTYLKRLDIDELKIDRSFIMQLDQDSSDAIIVASTIELGHNLGLRIVAEGVEDAATLEWLRGLGCDKAQGYHISRPTTAPAVSELALRLQGSEPKEATPPLRLVGNR